MQGAAVMVKMEVSRWRCLNRECERRTFADQLAGNCLSSRSSNPTNR